VANAQGSWLEGQVAKLRGSRAYRIGVAVLHPARVVHRRIRGGVR
jgi:hypothetical protein